MEKAIDYYEKAFAIGKEIKDTRSIIFARKNLALYWINVNIPTLTGLTGLTGST